MSLAAFGLEKVDLLRVNGNAPPVLQVQQDTVFEGNHEPSVRLPVVSAVKRGLGRLNGRFSGWAANLTVNRAPLWLIVPLKAPPWQLDQVYKEVHGSVRVRVLTMNTTASRRPPPTVMAPMTTVSFLSAR